MTVIRPNSIAGINSITAQGNSISIFKSDGSSGLELTGATINSSTGISTFNRLSVSNGAVISGVSTISSLNVTGTTTVGLGTTGSPSISPTGDSNTGVFFPSADTIAFAEGGIEAARFDSSGRLLVGTSTALLLDPALANYALNIETFIGGGVLNHSIGATRHGGPTPEAGPVISLARSRGTTAGSVTLVAQNDLLGLVEFCGADGTDFGTTAGSIASYVDGVAGTNDMPGRLVFATTSDGASSPTERMSINSTGTHSLYGLNDTLYSSTNRTAGTTYATYVGRYGATSTTTGTISFIVWSNGNVQNTNNSYGAYSDAKLKENIADAGSQWADLKALRVRSYNFKEGQTHRQIGLVAQEVELVSPGLVSESPDRDQEGNDLGTVTKSVNYSVLYMKAVKALQEAMERIEQLEAKVAALESV